MSEYVERTDIARKSMIIDLRCDVCNKVFGKTLLFSRDVIFVKPRCNDCLKEYPVKIMEKPSY